MLIWEKLEPESGRSLVKQPTLKIAADWLLFKSFLIWLIILTDYNYNICQAFFVQVSAALHKKQAKFKNLSYSV